MSIDVLVFMIFCENSKIDILVHAKGVRRHVASTCDRSFEARSVWGKVDIESMSYIDIEMMIIQHKTFKIGLGQTAPYKMTAMTIG